jgi:hypothetical protein
LPTASPPAARIRRQRGDKAMDYRILSKAGALRSGSDSRGSIFHAVPETNDYCGPALCGAKPTIQWGSRDGHLTCRRCERLLRLESPERGRNLALRQGPAPRAHAEPKEQSMTANYTYARAIAEGAANRWGKCNDLPGIEWLTDKIMLFGGESDPPENQPRQCPGCVCPPKSEETCRAVMCPRQSP